MKIASLNLSVLLLILGVSCSSDKQDITVMTYNIRHGFGCDGVLELSRITQVIATASPDIVILNEVDDGTSRSFGVRQTESLGQALGLNRRFGRSIDYDGGYYGNALLTRFPILSFEVMDISTHEMLEGRSVFRATLAVDVDTLVVLGTHLGLLAEEQSQQVEMILAALPSTGRLLLAGDLNFIPESAMYHRLNSQLLDGVRSLVPDTEYTFPADLPRRRIDYIFLGENLEPRDVVMQYDPLVYVASDHLPQILKFKLSTKN